MNTLQSLESILNGTSTALTHVDCRHPAFRYLRSIQQTARAEIARHKDRVVEPAPEPAPQYRSTAV